jgi:aryl-alcohol dehydrogenase-like predicted oxidoreductase
MSSSDPSVTRRGFIASAAATAAALTASPLAAQPSATHPASSSGGIPRRKFGKHDDQLSIIGVGGHAIGIPKLEAEAIQIVQRAIDAGINFMDNAWEYHDGESEKRMGKALAEGGRRDRVFLMTKVCTHGRDKKVGMQMLEESLKRLRTDRIDLWMIHEVVYENDPDLHFAKGGVIEALDEAKRQGKVRYVGFTGHKSPHIHAKMLAQDYPFDAVLMPLNAFDGSFRSFETDILPRLRERHIAPLGMKSLNGTGDAIKKGVIKVEEALRYAMSVPGVVTTVSGMDSLAVLEQNTKIARNFQPMPADEMAALRQRVAPQAADGRFELYKVSAKFEGPPGREQHGFPPAGQVQA